jgi:3',5'-cyclic-AMP phosphodiesterase
MRLAWTTDLHLNFVSEAGVRTFAASLAGFDGILVGGDTGEANGVLRYLDLLAEGSGRPIWFVLGNHDYYGGSIGDMRRATRQRSRARDDVTWLPDAGVVHLTDDTALVGHGGWGDGRAGDLAGSDVLLNDFLLIEELRRIPPEDWGPGLARLGDDAADRLRPIVEEAAAGHRGVIVLTHVPPFGRACWHDGRISGDDWQPFFVCEAMGQMLVDVFERFPDCHGTVLCGHTHSAGQVSILANLDVRTGGARYGHPRVEDEIEVDEPVDPGS